MKWNSLSTFVHRACLGKWWPWAWSCSLLCSVSNKNLISRFWPSLWCLNSYFFGYFSFTSSFFRTFHFVSQNCESVKLETSRIFAQYQIRRVVAAAEVWVGQRPITGIDSGERLREWRVKRPKCVWTAMASRFIFEIFFFYFVKIILNGISRRREECEWSRRNKIFPTSPIKFQKSFTLFFAFCFLLCLRL